MRKKPKIIGLGEILWDVYPTDKKAGGAPVNFVFHAIQMGASGYAISAVGEDKDGEELLEMLDGYSIPYCIPKVANPTGTVQVTLQDGNPTYTIVEDVAWDNIPLVVEMEEMVKDADAICFGTLAQRSTTSKRTLRELIECTPESALRCFDINLRQHFYSKEVILESLELANVLKLNDEELYTITKLLDLPSNIDVACHSLIKKYSLHYLILTAGAKFSSIYTTNELSRISTPKVENIVDTVGAGDAFLGAFVYSILSGKSLAGSHQKAVEIAAFVCTKQGGWTKYDE